MFRINLSRSSRLAAATLGFVAASIAWSVGLVSGAMSPDEARERRAVPELPPPSVTITKQSLAAVSWSDCTRDSSTVPVQVPKLPEGFRSVVTQIADAGSRVETGTVLARVADQSIIAVTTRTIFYRDFRLGDRGADVLGLEKALVVANVIANADPVFDVTTQRGMSVLAGGEGIEQVGRTPTVIAVPPGARIADVQVQKGQSARSGTPLLNISSGSMEFECGVEDPPLGLMPSNVEFEVDGQTVGIGRLTVRQRTAEGPGSVSIGLKEEVSGDSARIGIVAARTEGDVLTVPISALKTRSDGTQAVVLLTDTSRSERPVNVGVTAQGLIEISGPDLRAGESVLLFDATTSPPSDAGGADTPDALTSGTG